MEIKSIQNITTQNNVPVKASKKEPSGNVENAPMPGQGVDRKELDQAVSRMNERLQAVQRSLQFSVDEETGRTVVKVIDAETEEVIRQLPPEELLEFARFVSQQQDGTNLILREKA